MKLAQWSMPSGNWDGHLKTPFWKYYVAVPNKNAKAQYFQKPSDEKGCKNSQLPRIHLKLYAMMKDIEQNIYKFFILTAFTFIVRLEVTYP